MGVYIKGMEMPKGCYECPLMDGEYGDCKVGATGLYDQYKEDCPLTKVPEPLPSTNNWMEKVFQEKLGIKTANEILSSEEELGNWIERMLWHVNHIDDDNWIPVSERLPKKGEVVLITNGKGNVRCGQYRSEYDVRDRTHYWWWKGKTVESVLAWQPLPKPYKGGDDE